MSVAPETDREKQSFAETALRLGGKSEEEARRMGAIDKADEQVEALFAPQYQTANSPVHRAVWDGNGPARPVRAAAPARVGPVRRRDGAIARRRPPPPRGRHRSTTRTARSPQTVLDDLAEAGYWGLLIDPKYGGQGRAVRRASPVPDADGDDRRDGRRPGLGPRLHRRRRSGADLRHAEQKAALPAQAGQRRGALRLRPDRARRRLRPDRPAHHRRARRRRLRGQRREAVHHQRRPRPDHRPGRA